MKAFPPVLRSPPFPATAAHIAAVSVARASPTPRISLSSAECERAGHIIAAIRDARVGGSFWGRAAADIPGDSNLHDPWDVIARGEVVAVPGDSEIGLLAWIAGIDVRWTETGRYARFVEDGLPDPLERAVTTWLVDAAEYRDPYSGRAAAIETAIEQLAFWRREFERNRGIAVATGMALWKRREIETMLWSGQPLRFARNAGSAIRAAQRRRGAIANWATRTPADLVVQAQAAAVDIVSVEDGFLRSAGLGSDLVPPCSITVDRTGLHLDPARASDLEALIADPVEDPQALRRAQWLRRKIVETGLGKYGVADEGFERPAQARRLVLVAGQVEDDLSVQLGGAGISSNLELLRRARAAEPDAWLLFKPHPDVDAGHRRGAIDDSEALRHVDQLVRDVPMASLLDVADAVHVLTSLTGFEALIRGCEVVVHGQPFYAGWGLTRDLAPPIHRRGRRKLTVDQLLASVLIVYPRYLDPVTRLPCPPEILVERLTQGTPPHSSLLTRARRWQGRFRRALDGIAKRP